MKNHRPIWAIARNAKGHWLVAVHNIGGHVRIADTIQQFAKH